MLELGLGNGRTYDHLRERMPNRDIYVFERKVAAHPSCVPPEDHLFLGDISDTLPQAAERIGGQAILVHSDIGTGVEAYNNRMAKIVAAGLPALIKTGALIVSDQWLPAENCEEIALPKGVSSGRYFFAIQGITIVEVVNIPSRDV